jgi:flagellar basal-body rod modification protein FlgD
MAPIGSSQSSASGSQTGKAPAAPAQIDKNMFLQLLVAQLRNQNPLNPTDSMQFVQQLAQFQQLEESVNTGQDIAAMRQDLDKIVAPGTASTQAQ